jgi:hypothetical protein
VAGKLFGGEPFGRTIDVGLKNVDSAHIEDPLP